MTSDFYTNLINPPTDCYPVVMWFWNDTITSEEIIRQLEEFKEQKIYEFFIHPMFGLNLRYLSEQFFAHIGTAIRYARENDMKFWIYDEYNWPSGTAGGTLIKKHPWTKASCLCCARYDLQPEQEISADFGWPVLDGYFTPERGRTLRIRNLTCTKTGFLWKNDKNCKGTLTVLYRSRRQELSTTVYGARYSNEEPGYLDLLNAKAVDLFLKSTHEKYKAHFPEDFGNTLKGVFTDEPAYSYHFDPNDGVVPYTDHFYAAFKNLKGYDARSRAWKMFTPLDDPDSAVFKKDWFETLSHLFEVNFSVKYKNWCADNNILFTGHLFCEESLAAQVYYSGQYYDILKHFDRPGMDTILSKKFVQTECFNVTGYLVGSVAKFAGKQRVLCEAYSGSGWDFSLNDQKKIANLLMIEGINFLMYMGAYYSMRGPRKVLPCSYPPSHSSLNPQFIYYKQFNEYIARLQYLSSQTVSDGTTMVLYPQITYMAQADPEYHLNVSMNLDYYSPGTWTEKDASLCAVVNALQRLNRPFHIGFETALASAEVRDGKLCLAGSEYETIILPGAEYIKGNTAKLLKEFAAQNGKIILVNTAAVRDIENRSTVIFRAEPRAAKALALQLSGDENSQRATYVFRKKNLASLVTNETSFKYLPNLTNALDKLYAAYGLREKFRIKGSGIYSGVRKLDDLYCIFLINDTDSRNCGSVFVDDFEAAAVIDPQTLRQDGYARQHEQISLEFAGYGSKIMFSGSENAVNRVLKELSLSVSRCNPTILTRKGKTLDVTAVFPYNLKRLYYRIALPEKTAGLLKLSPTALESLLLEAPETYLQPMGTPGQSDTYTAADKRLYPPLQKGSSYVAYSEFQLQSIPDTVEFLCENMNRTKIIINGHLLRNLKKSPHFNQDDLSKEITPLLKEGKNTVILLGETENWGTFHTLPFTVLKGDFILSESETLEKPQTSTGYGDITQMGYPNFAGVYHYSATVYGKKYSLLELQSYDAAEVFVNGIKAAELLYAPRICDLSPYLTEGENQIQITFRTKMNNLFADPEKTGLISAKLF